MTSQARPAPPVTVDDSLSERAETQWQFGDWQRLSQLNTEALQHHPNRAKLALWAAIAQLQIGQTSEAKASILNAKDWGIDQHQLGQMLIAGVHNSLGRAAALSIRQDHARQHFENAIQIGTPGGAQKLLVDVRTKHELNILGLLPGSRGRLQKNHAHSRSSNQSEPMGAPETPPLRPTSAAHAFYVRLGQQQEKCPVPFLLIDSKSLPRSGLHYLKNTLNKVFGEYFSFCEWYQEPGCCRQSPCSYTGFATHAQDTSSLRIRLIKSHDFALDDPIYPTSLHLQRLILVRDPLYILTSWFALDQLEAHKDLLAKNGIMTNKIWLAHEKEVLKPAYEVLDQHFQAPSTTTLANWLLEKRLYIAEFMRKWVEPYDENEPSGVHIVNYDQINEYIRLLTDQYSAFISEGLIEKINGEGILAKENFQKRTDVFSSPSKKVSEYIKENDFIFLKFTQELRIN